MSKQTIGQAMAAEDLAEMVAKAGGEMTREEALEAIERDCEEWGDLRGEDGRINVLRYAALLHRAIR